MSKFKNAKALALGQGITFLASFLLLPYLSRALPIGDYGTYGQTILYIGIFKAIALLGLNKVIFIYLSKYDDKGIVYTNNLFIVFCLGLIIAIITNLSAPIISVLFENTKLILPIKIYSFIIPFETTFTCFSSILVHENKSKLLASIAVVSNLIKYLFLFVIIQYTINFNYIFWGLLAASSIQLMLVVLFSKISFLWKKISSSVWLPQIKLGVPLGLTSIIGTLYYITDGFIVSLVLSPEEYAILRNGAFQIPFISTLYSIIGIVLMKDISDFIQNNNYGEIINLKSRAIAIAVVLIFPITLYSIIFASYWIPFMFTSLYSGSIIVFMIYNIMTLFRITDYENIIVLSENGSRLPSIYIKSFLLNVLLSLPLTYFLGPSGSAFASILSFLYLIFALTSINLNILKARLSELINLNHVLKISLIIFTSAFTTILFFKIISTQYNLSFILPILVLLLLSFTYHILLKANFISDKDKHIVFKNIPIQPIKLFCIKQYCK